jgi:hypothetical protein
MNRRQLAFRYPIAAAVLLGSDKARAQSRGAQALIGAWDVTTTNLDGNPPPGPSTARRLITYAYGGTVFDFSGSPGEIPAQGVWDYAGNNTFEGTWLRLIRNSDGLVIATNRVRSRIHLKSEDEYENEAKVEIFDPEGKVLFSWRASGRGRRIKLEPFD